MQFAVTTDDQTGQIIKEKKKKEKNLKMTNKKIVYLKDKACRGIEMELEDGPCWCAFYLNIKLVEPHK